MTKEIYNKSVDILLDAYNEERLFHKRCDACAVGNLLGGNMIWGCDFVTANGSQNTIGMKYIADFRKRIHEVTGTDYYLMPIEEIYNKLHQLYAEKGYTQKELMQIEYAFEMAIYRKDDDTFSYEYYTEEDVKTGQYLGLVAVLKIMESMVEEPVSAQENMTRLQTIAHKYKVAV